jgi:1-phosphofructokinase
MTGTNDDGTDRQSQGRTAAGQSDNGRICVLAPWPILTVTIEAGPAGEDEIYVHAGGQGFWVARMIRNLGGRPLLCGPFGGEIGVAVQALTQAEGVVLRAVPSAGWNGAYVHDRRGGKRQAIAEMKSAGLSRHERDNLYNAVLSAGLDCGIVVLTGVMNAEILPSDFFRRIARDLDANGAVVVADLSGDALKALDGGVTFLKVSHEELMQAGYCRAPDLNSVVEGVGRLRSSGARNIVVSCGDEPAVALLGERYYIVKPPKFDPLDHRGAGDSMTAALAIAQARRLGPRETLQLGAAAGCMNVTRHGLGTGQIEDIERVAKKVEVEAFHPRD